MNTQLPGKLFDGVFRRVLGGELSAELRASLAREEGLDLDHLLPRYPRSVWYGAVSRTASELFPGREGQRRLGRHIIDTLEQRKLIKGAWLGVAKMLGPRRALRQAADHVEHSPIRLSIVEKAKTEFEILVDELEQPEFLAGLLEGAIGMLGGHDARAVVEGPRGDVMVISATWR